VYQDGRCVGVTTLPPSCALTYQKPQRGLLYLF